MAAQGLRETLAAILAADASGYSRLMDGDQHAKVAALDAARGVFRQQIEASRGHLVDTAGDSVLPRDISTCGAATALRQPFSGASVGSGSRRDDRLGGEESFGPSCGSSLLSDRC